MLLFFFFNSWVTSSHPWDEVIRNRGLKASKTSRKAWTLQTSVYIPVYTYIHIVYSIHHIWICMYIHYIYMCLYVIYIYMLYIYTLYMYICYYIQIYTVHIYIYIHRYIFVICVYIIFLCWCWWFLFVKDEDFPAMGMILTAATPNRLIAGFVLNHGR